MVINQRWLEGVSPQTPVTEVARRALSLRVPLVFYYFPLATWHSVDDSEYVHQLRVACRRAETAVDTFRFLLPASKAKRVRKGLQAARRAAGPARELDVLASWLHRPPLEIPLSKSAMKHLHKAIAKRRVAAQPAIVSVFEAQREAELERRASKLSRQIRWRGSVPETPWRDVARELLLPAVDQLLRRAEHTGSTQELHALRISCKKLRYRMELTAAAMNAAFRKRVYPQLRSIQQRLGEINDLACAAERVRRLADEVDTSHDWQPLTECLDQQAVRTANSFCQWWTSDRQKSFADAITAAIGFP